MESPEWVQPLLVNAATDGAFDDMMDRLEDVNAGRHFTRDEMNER
jgi:hypothetical protein